MPNYNTTLQSNNTDLQAILNSINELPEAGGGSGSDEADSLITSGLSTYTNNRVSNIRTGVFFNHDTLVSVNFPNCISIGGKKGFGPVSFVGAFTSCSKLTTINFPKVETIGFGAFGSCSLLTTANFPVATSIYDYAFYGCWNLTATSFPVATYIGSNAFYNCSKLTTVSFPVATTIGIEAFYGCYSLATISFPEVTTIGSQAFKYCSNLTTVSFPKVTDIGYSAFMSCRSLTTISFPVVKHIGACAFQSCYSLTTASFPEATGIGSSAFMSCYNLTSLYLTGSKICTLSRSDAFSSTPIGGYSTSAGTYGSIYVPASLLDTYKKQANWVYFSSRFVAYDSGANLISFTINGTPYQAEEGMTWAEWVDSSYNTIGAVNGGTAIRIMDETLVSISPTYPIYNDCGYATQSYHVGGGDH